MKDQKNSSIGATFYQQKNFSGTPHEYKEREVVYELPSELNDTFLSVKIGKQSLVHGWRHFRDSQADQIYKVWTESTSDITEIQGLSKFVVAPKNTQLLSIKLTNSSENTALDYVFVQTYTIDNPVNILVNDDFQIVGLIPNDGRMYVTSVILFDKNKVPMEIGAAYFMYDAPTDSLNFITYPETFPAGWKLVKRKDYRFELIIENIKESSNGVAFVR